MDNIEVARPKLAENRASIAPWQHAEDYTALPRQLRLGVVHLLSDALATADSPHTSDHLIEDTLALSSYGTQYLASHLNDKCTLERIATHKSCREKEKRQLDATAANLARTWRCQRFPTHGMPPLELNTSDYLIPEVQTLQKAGGSVVQPVAEVNEGALRVEIKRCSKTLRRRVEVRQQELVRELQRQQREQLENRERKKLGFRKGWAHLISMETPAAHPSVDAAANGSSVDTAATAATAGSTPVVLAVKTPLERLNEAVDKNPLDFNSWTSLLTLVQSEPETPRETVETTYGRFLAEFPLCFGYWNKYAQYEYGLGSKMTEDGMGTVATLEEATQKARNVYERGVVAVRYSVDMWIKYCEFLIHTLHSPVDETRLILERAIEACGADPLAGPLWEIYIQLETVNNDMPRLNQVFKRIMLQPLRNLEEFWEKYNQFVLAQQLQALATPEEQKSLAGDGEELMDEGLLRVKIVNAVEAAKNKTMEDIYRRQAFEAGIDRSYFHVTPVTEAAMKNWHSYLDFEEAAGDDARCQTLYERCLISCANYEEVWLRYVAWNEKVRGFEAADAVFQRAVTIFLKYRASVYLEYAAFLEAHEKLQKAQDTYMKVLSDVAPKLAEAFLHYCNFERRRGDVETAKTWYERGMETTENETEVYSYMAVSYATFLHKTLGDVTSARTVFECAVQKHSESALLWLNYLHFEINAGGDNTELVPRVSQVYDLALEGTCNLTMDEKNDLWFQYVEFMENYASSVAQVRGLRKKEMDWKLKNAQSRNRTIKVLTFQSGWDVDMGGYSSSVDPGMKRPRYAAPQTSAVLATPAMAATAATPTSAAAAYYQGYQGYGAQAQAYSQADATVAVGQQSYSQAQYASYYQQ